MANKSHTDSTESTEMEPSQMAGDMGSLRSKLQENCSKNYSKYLEPSQMAFYMGSPEGEKLQENLIQN